jgi:hypothetical protein
MTAQFSEFNSLSLSSVFMDFCLALETDYQDVIKYCHCGNDSRIFCLWCHAAEPYHSNGMLGCIADDRTTVIQGKELPQSISYF